MRFCCHHVQPSVYHKRQRIARCVHGNAVCLVRVLCDNEILVAGTATIEGLDICSDMADIYAMMGVCPQHDLLWETLTGREHLLFYGRLKNLKVSPPCSSDTSTSPMSGVLLLAELLAALAPLYHASQRVSSR